MKLKKIILFATVNDNILIFKNPYRALPMVSFSRSLDPLFYLRSHVIDVFQIIKLYVIQWFMFYSLKPPEFRNFPMTFIVVLVTFYVS